MSRNKVLFDAIQGTSLLSKQAKEVLSIFKLFARYEKKMRRCLGDNWFYSNVAFLSDKLQTYSNFESNDYFAAGEDPPEA